MRIYGEILVFQVYHGPTKKETHAYRWPTGEYIVVRQLP